MQRKLDRAKVLNLTRHLKFFFGSLIRSLLFNYKFQFFFQIIKNDNKSILMRLWIERQALFFFLPNLVFSLAP